TAVFGTIYANALGPHLRDGVGAAVRTGAADPSVIAGASTSPEGVHRLPAPASAPIVEAYADTIQTVFLWTVPVAVLGFVVALFLRQVPLRDSARAGSTDMGEGFASPHDASSRRTLEASVGK
ncbi:MFS transporter, partial [Streptomyces sp. SID6648]|nr:MFS transporter [Streptomyces sp. SID6648]